jgi:adenosylcobinamide-GDP ribazoletransferase
MSDLLRALSLLTTLPVRATWDEHRPPGTVMAAYPLAGAVIGLLVAGLALALRWSGLGDVAPLLPPALVLAAWVILTGALHLDGWADCCDGLLVPVAPERRLEIMKDPRLGSFGGAGLFLLLVVKLGAVQGLMGRAGDLPASWIGTAQALLPWLLAPMLARWAVVVAAWAYPPAKPEGMAAYFRQGLGRRQVLIASLSVLPVAAAAGVTGLVLWGGAAIALWAVAGLAVTRIGGLTGDVYGAVIELSETVVLLLAVIWSL